MNQQIEQYINEIVVDKDWDIDHNYEYIQINKNKYYGDGQGDFEKSSYDVTNKCLIDHIAYCREQIALAKNELKKRKLAKKL
jgi:hypothetical protein